MITKLTRQGDQFFLPIDRETVQRMGIDVETPLSVSAEDGRLIATPENGQARQRKLHGILTRIDAEYGDVLKRLAE